MIVYAFWDSTPDAPEDQAVFVATWYEQCLKDRAVPHLLTARDAQKYKKYKEALACGRADEHTLAEWAFKSKRARVVKHLCADE